MLEQLQNLITNQLQNQFLTGGLILGLATTILYQLKGLPSFVWDRIRRKLIYNVTVEQGSELYGYTQYYLNKNYNNRITSVRAFFIRNKESYSNKPSSTGEFREDNELLMVPHSDNFLLWREGRLIRISSTEEKMDKTPDYMSSPLFHRKFYISGLMAKEQITSLLREIVDVSLKREQKRKNPFVYRSGRYEWSKHEDVSLKSIDTVFLNKESKNYLLNDIDSFYKSKKFYGDRGLAYRRGYCLHGSPGNGKTSLVSAIAKNFFKNLYILNLKGINDEADFESQMADIKSGSILLIEDIDSYFDKRESKTKVSFSCFINTISGINSAQDVVLFITTNNFHTLDDALIRSGRIDMVVEIKNPTILEVNEYLSFFYEKDIKLTSFKPMSMADVENICFKNKHDSDSTILELEFAFSLNGTYEQVD